MAATVPFTITFSTIAALTIVPWMAYKLLGHRKLKHESLTLDPKSASHNVTPEWIRRGYRRLVMPFLTSRKKRYWLLGSIIAALGFCAALVLLEVIPLQLLPFGNTNDLQLVIDMPQGTTLEQTNRAVEGFENYL